MNFAPSGVITYNINTFSAPSTVFGTNGNDLLNGTPGNDIIQGGAGNDRLRIFGCWYKIKARHLNLLRPEIESELFKFEIPFMGL